MAIFYVIALKTKPTVLSNNDLKCAAHTSSQNKTLIHS